MQISYKAWKEKYVNDTVLKEVICNFQKVLNKCAKSIQKVLKILKSVRKSH